MNSIEIENEKTHKRGGGGGEVPVSWTGNKVTSCLHRCIKSLLFTTAAQTRVNICLDDGLGGTIGRFVARTPIRTPF